MLPLWCPRVSQLACTILVLASVQTPALAQPVSGRPATKPSVPAEPSATAPTLAGALRHTADRLGLWGSLGLGRASAGLRCATCADESTRAYVLEGSIGMRVSPQFLMGVETFAWLDVFGGGVDRISRGTYLVGRLYPYSQDRLFLNGGVGVASFRIYDGDIGFTTRSPSMSLAAGYDWRLANVTLTPSIAAIMSTGGRLRSSRTSNSVDDNARLTMFRTSVNFSWFR